MTYTYHFLMIHAESKHKKHIAGSMQRQEPTVQRLSQKYNELCRSMAHLIETGNAPAGAVVPEIIPPGGLWKLDVDDTIWQDIGLEDDDHHGQPPLWLSNEKVRAGIHSMLDLDRCLEEEKGLFRERVSLQDWVVEEWAVVTIASEETGQIFSLFLSFTCSFWPPIDDIDMLYRYQDILSYLGRLAYTWRQKVRLIEHPFGLECWGPSAQQLEDISIQELTAQVEPGAELLDSDDDDESSGSSIDQDSDEELYDHMEALVLNEQYQESRDFIIAEVDISPKRRRVD